MIGAVIAMQSEADILLDEMRISRSLSVSGKKIHVGTAYGKNIAVCVCGVGKVNAALGAQILVSKFDVKKLLNFGVAGSLNKTTELCSVYQIRLRFSAVKRYKNRYVERIRRKLFVT